MVYLIRDVHASASFVYVDWQILAYDTEEPLDSHVPIIGRSSKLALTKKRVPQLEIEVNAVRGLFKSMRVEQKVPFINVQLTFVRTFNDRPSSFYV